ncbi:AraC family transcriptional regulator [Rathayibacter sp. AY2B9]|uniref:helix-turn-helix transcriptional regulator n=1 Tax=Rathayibacter sp. AY2B9 TaxID=2080572 RepID=UPI000CE86C99|nr:AraC family transcriptional regulator [Rathayibacter sp. AY2B9]PPG26573.1 AraC family transcriptional regulator [Rathayibacter sp. AY2B9]
MDPLEHFLSGPRASRAFALLVDMDGAWALDVRDGAPLTVVAVLAGSVLLDGTPLGAGDAALVRGPEPYTVSDAAGSPPTIRIDPGHRCVSLDGRDLSDELRNGVRHWGTASGGGTGLLVASYDRSDEVGGLVLRSLPRVAIVPGHGAVDPVVGLLAGELAREGTAGRVVIDRLLDVLTVSTVRRWAELAAHRGETWLTCDDAVVLAALDRLHSRPAEAWTVESLARSVNVSRATLAERFRAGVGRPPMEYLARWRLTVAADLLLDPGRTVASVAREVGYENAFAFSTAFKRQAGATPSEFRRQRAPVL